MTRDKDRLADQERSERDYRETYGRGGGEAFADADYPHSYAPPGASDWRRALRAYVDGHDRGWGAERKEREAAAAVEASRPEREEEPDRAPAPGAASEEADEEATARTARGWTPFGVEIPDRDELVFHRAASTWRERLPRADRMPRHADRDLDGRTGRGEQA